MIFHMKSKQFEGNLVAAFTLGLVAAFPIFDPDVTIFKAEINIITNIAGYAENTLLPSRYVTRADPGPEPDPFPWSVNFVNFEPNHCAEATKAKIAFGDALELALTALKADFSGPAFTRYFQPADEPQVKAVFTTLLHASTMLVAESVLDLWTLFTIHYDVMSDPPQAPAEDCSADPTLISYLVTEDEDPGLGNKAVCLLVSGCLFLPQPP
jgi:hypothetical protein